MVHNLCCYGQCTVASLVASVSCATRVLSLLATNSNFSRCPPPNCTPRQHETRKLHLEGAWHRPGREHHTTPCVGSNGDQFHPPVTRRHIQHNCAQGDTRVLQQHPRTRTQQFAGKLIVTILWADIWQNAGQRSIFNQALRAQLARPKLETRWQTVLFLGNLGAEAIGA